MRTETVTRRIGELLGPVDWSYDFASHFQGDQRAEERCLKQLDRLRRLADAPDDWEATTDGGWPRVGWGDVLAVGMYDGWPYWRPVPSVCLRSPLGGGEWHSFTSITNIENKKTGERL